MRSLATTAALFATAATARVMDSLSSVPQGWSHVRAATPDEAITLKVALPQQRAAALERAVVDMSTPGHAQYGRHLTRDELRSYTAPLARDVSAVTEWLAGAGIVADGAESRVAVDNDWLTLSTTVGRANALLNTNFAWYQYEKGGGPRLRTLQYSVPDEIANSIDLIQPTTRFGQLGARKSTIFDMHILGPADEAGTEDKLAKAAAAAAASSPGGTPTAAAAPAECTVGAITPACLKALYNIKYTPSASGNQVAFGSYLEEYARNTDLSTFESSYAKSAVGQSFTVELINGGLNNQQSSSDSGEANLDIQYILGVSAPIPILEYSTGGRGPLVPTIDEPGPSYNEPYLEFLTYLLNKPDGSLPQTLSTSYGEEEQSVPADYALKVCNMFMQLGARGVSVLFSSGDSGPGDSCIRQSDQATYFQPTFPGACPYITSVGATSGVSPEAAVGFSSGGFSSLHKRPSWQDSAVSTYLSSIGSTYAPYFNASNRGFPDVATQGSSFIVIDKGRRALLSGTSASSPTFAGVVALLNAARKSQGLAPLGFLNPFLYANAAAFTDIKTGSGNGCSGNRAFRNGARWNATTGWDPVTGLGTPLFDKLLAAAAPGVTNA